MARHFQSSDVESQAGESTALTSASSSSSSASSTSSSSEEEYNLCSCLENASLAKSLVFGGFDGLVNSLTVISGVIGAGMSWRVALVVGLANIVANSLFIGFSEFFSSTAHRAFLQSEKRREIWEFNRFRNEEMKSMVDRFVSRGMGKKDADLVVTKMAKYEDFFVRLMMSEELGSNMTDVDDTTSALKDAFILFIAFGLFGSFPVSFCLLGTYGMDSHRILYIAASASLSVVFLLGIAKSNFSTSNWAYSGLESLSLGLLCFTASYGVGLATNFLVTQEPYAA